MRQDERRERVADGFDVFNNIDRPPVIYEMGERVVVELHGEIDILALQRDAPVLETLSVDSGGVVVADLRRATFFDCSGLTLLVGLYRRVRAQDARLTVVCNRPLTRRLIAMSGLTERLSPVSTMEEALQ